MKKGTRDILIIGGVGLAGYLLIQNRRAAAQPVPMAPVPATGSGTIGGAIGSLLNAIGGAFGAAGKAGSALLPTPGVPVPPAPSSGGGILGWLNSLLPSAVTPPAPALAPVEGFGIYEELGATERGPGGRRVTAHTSGPPGTASYAHEYQHARMGSLSGDIFHFQHGVARRARRY